MMVSRLRVKDVIAATADHFGVSVDQIMGRRRCHPEVMARQVAVYLAWQVTDYPLTQIGATMNRDRTSARHARDKIEKLVRQDPAFALEIAEIELSLIVAGRALDRLGIERDAPSAGEIATTVLAAPSRLAMQVPTDGVVTLAIAVSEYEDILRDLPDDIAALAAVARAGRAYVEAVEECTSASFDDAARDDARSHLATALQQLTTAVAEQRRAETSPHETESDHDGTDHDCANA